MKLKELFDENMMPNWERFNEIFPEMAICHHSNRWHSEGSPLQHTKLVTNEMFKKTFNKVTDEEYLILMSAAMLHDIGKPSTTYWNEDSQDWCCQSHGEAGEHLFRNLFRDEDIVIREQVAYMIRYHMVLHNILDKKKNKQKTLIASLADGTVSLENMLLLFECDMRGSVNEECNNEFIESKINAIEELWYNRLPNRWNYVNEDTSIAFVMIGVPGSGKTTYAKSEFSLPTISRDIIRSELGYCKEGEKFLGNEEQEKKVSVVFNRKLKEFAEKGENFVIDNTSLKKKYRRQYSELYEKYNIIPIYVYVEAPSMEENIKRRDGEIEARVIKSMWNTMEFPSKDECYMLWAVDPITGKTRQI